ncbi:hypothetical protein [Streptomyces afghaniensis]|uniref:hypothetical protein n=1 Tax=Streptomyces afghaniensis TaxID=66865 RepID=UPI0027D7CAB8|nr:hypothetical protein [Streptomyces afghaniensis]
MHPGDQAVVDAFRTLLAARKQPGPWQPGDDVAIEIGGHVARPAPPPAANPTPSAWSSSTRTPAPRASAASPPTAHASSAPGPRHTRRSPTRPPGNRCPDPATNPAVFQLTVSHPTA